MLGGEGGATGPAHREIRKTLRKADLQGRAPGQSGESERQDFALCTQGWEGRDFRVYLSSKKHRHRVSEPRPCVLLPTSQPTPTHLVPSPRRCLSKRRVLPLPKGWLSRPF